MLYDSIYRTSGKGNATGTETDPWLLGLGSGVGGSTTKGWEGVLGELTLLYIIIVVSYTTVCVC